MTPPAACVFCGVVADGSQLVVDTADVCAFLDVRPLFKGHLLVIPREHHETLADVPSTLLEPLFATVQRAMQALSVELGAAGTFVAVNNRVSQSVPHLHVHVVPRRPKDGLRGFFWPRTRYQDDAERDRYRDRLRTALGYGGRPDGRRAASGRPSRPV